MKAMAFQQTASNGSIRMAAAMLPNMSRPWASSHTCVSWK